MADGIKSLLIGSATLDTRIADAGMLFLRVFAGLALAFGHGLGKVPPAEGFVTRIGEMGMPAPEVFATLSAFAEFGCGLLLAIGLLTRPASLFILGNMVVVVLMAHAADPFSGKEKGLLFGAIALFYLLAGGGRYSLDSLLRRKSSQRYPVRV